MGQMITITMADGLYSKPTVAAQAVAKAGRMVVIRRYSALTRIYARWSMATRQGLYGYCPRF